MTTFSKNWGDHAVRLIELSYIDGGWCIAETANGRYVNRWEEQQDVYPERFEATREYISALMAKDMADSGIAA